MPLTESPAWDPNTWLKQWTTVMQLAPQTLVQPILPGMTLNVNAFNSAAPQTEAAVLQKFSYGRQLGRLTEALAVLVDERDPKRADVRFQDFRDMADEIETIKGHNAAARVQRLIDDLDALSPTLGADDAKRLQAELRKRLVR